MSKDWMVLLQEQNQLSNVMKTNETTEQFGLSLTEQDAKLILAERKNALAEQKRIEFGGGIVTKIIYEFCDSDYIHQSNYVETIIRLQEIFYLYKNEMHDEITDDELLHLMKEQFENIDGYGEYSKFDDVKRWDYDLYLETLKELCWR